MPRVNYPNLLTQPKQPTIRHLAVGMPADALCANEPRGARFAGERLTRRPERVTCTKCLEVMARDRA